MEIEIAGKRYEITYDMVVAWKLGEHGERFGMYSDGNFAVGQSVGFEICEEERPLIIVPCEGIGNLNEGYFAEGWATWDEETQGWIETETGTEMSTQEMIARTIREGDGQFHEELISEIRNIIGKK